MWMNRWVKGRKVEKSNLTQTERMERSGLLIKLIKKELVDGRMNEEEGEWKERKKEEDGS